MFLKIRNIKIRNIIIIFIVSLGIALTGCDESLLNTKPNYKYTSSNFWNSEGAAKTALTGIYAVLRYGGLYGGTATPLWEETASPNAYDYDNSDGFNAIAEGEQSATTGGIISTRWQDCYIGIGRTNTFL
jgi:hypothetical protein